MIVKIAHSVVCTVMLAPILFTEAWAQTSASQTFLSLSNHQPICSTMSSPSQIPLGMKLSDFIRVVKQQLGVSTTFAKGEDDEKIIVQVPALRIFVPGWGEMESCQFMFMKTKTGPLLGAVQSDVTGEPKALAADKLAAFMVVMGKPRSSDTSDDVGAPMKSFTWNSDTSKSVIFSFYSYSDRGMKQRRELFVVGDTQLSPFLRKL